MVSLYDRLGGHVLKWSNLKGQQWGGATLPLQHDGEFFNIEIKVGVNVIGSLSNFKLEIAARMAQNSRFNEQKQYLCTCVSY